MNQKLKNIVVGVAVIFGTITSPLLAHAEGWYAGYGLGLSSSS